ncbi:hypothetical protein PAEPH01_0410 [Pancytospora epiphaga]|nr:hypothetical protein PAEPH01_0410 [Pancytospora epiphaga]
MFITVCFVLYLLGNFVKGGRSERDHHGSGREVAGYNSGLRATGSGGTLENEGEQAQGRLLEMSMECFYDLCSPNPRPESLNGVSMMVRYVLRGIGRVGFGVAVYMAFPYIVCNFSNIIGILTISGSIIGIIVCIFLAFVSLLWYAIFARGTPDIVS